MRFCTNPTSISDASLLFFISNAAASMTGLFRNFSIFLWHILYKFSVKDIITGWSVLYLMRNGFINLAMHINTYSFVIVRGFLHIILYSIKGGNTWIPTLGLFQCLKHFVCYNFRLAYLKKYSELWIIPVASTKKLILGNIFKTN